MHTMRILVLLICLVLFVSSVQAGIPGIEWQKTLGGSRTEEGYHIQQTSDSGYILIGNTGSSNGDVTENHGGYDIWVVKLSETGDILWQKTLGGSEMDYGHYIQQTSDGGYILIGGTWSSDGDVTGDHGDSEYVWVVKLSEVGDIQWQKTLGGSGMDRGHSIQQTSDGSYILIGVTGSFDGDVHGNNVDSDIDIWIVKLSDTGEILWQKTLGGSNRDFGEFIQQTSYGGYILTGLTYSSNGDATEYHDNCDIWVVKLSEVGDIQWQKILGGSEMDYGHYIQQTSDGGYILIGATWSFDGDVTKKHGYPVPHHNPDIWVVKLSEVGDIQWQKALGGSDNDSGYSIQQTSDGGYLLTGNTESSDDDVTENHGNWDAWILKLSDTGDIQWQKALGGNDNDSSYSVQQTSDGGYILTGLTESSDGDVSENHGDVDVWVVKLLDTRGF